MAGFRVLPHVADLILEAWGPGRPECFAAAVQGLVATFADAGGTPADRSVGFSVTGATDEDLVVRLLEEVIFLVDAEGRVPVSVTVTDAAAGRLRGSFGTVAVERVEESGALPKGVSRSGVEFACDDAGDGHRCRCRVIVDV